MPNDLVLTITFLSPEQGGRLVPPDLRQRGYRPHLVLATDTASTQMLGVEVLPTSSRPECGVPLTVHAHPLYSGVDYSALQAGVHIRVLEGPNVVAIGVVERAPVVA